MKIVVTEMPKTPRDCLFSSKHVKSQRYYVCNLHPNIVTAEGCFMCLCKDVKNCDRLIPLDDALELRDHDFDEQLEVVNLDIKLDEYLED